LGRGADDFIIKGRTRPGCAALRLGRAGTPGKGRPGAAAPATYYTAGLDVGFQDNVILELSHLSFTKSIKH